MLSKEYRLVKRGSFAYVRSHGNKFSDRYLIFVTLRGRCKRIGFVVSNKVGKAVRRNLVKRRMRGIVREALPSMRGGQMIFIAHAGIAELAYPELRSRMLALMAKAGVLREENA